MADESPFRRGVNYKKLSQKYISLLLLLFLTPLVFLFLGFIISRSPNERPTLIYEYNQRTQEWFTKRFAFLDTSFIMNNTKMEKQKRQSGPFYPVCDTCNRTDDPLEGCIYTSSTIFQTELDFIENELYYVVHNGNNKTYINDHASFVYLKKLNKKDLHCSSLSECKNICTKQRGTWYPKTEICNITLYLHEICYRVQINSDDISLDTSDYVNSNNVGCYYSSDWSPFVYDNVPPQKPTTLTIKLNVDPEISASLTTKGCSDSYLSNAVDYTCFGKSHEDQMYMSRTLVLISIVLFAVEVMSIFLICIFWVGKKRHISPTRIMSPSYEQIFTPLTYAELHPVDLPNELAGLGTKGLQERIATNGSLRVPKLSFADSAPGPVEILNV